MAFGKICNKAFEKYNIDKSLLLNNLMKREKLERLLLVMV